ncbi:MAG: acyl-CoA/acyl-ACP dehydrogenase [Gammaproteobacteria bacterium]|nr:acyl-CoA/acyl-ACP dehydrogenase [Gammaproteobacteria bacterium]
MQDIGRVEAEVQALALGWRSEGVERRNREALDSRDFDALAETGFTLTGVPQSEGGLFTDLGTCIRPYARMLSALAGVDPSLALVASMHPVVLGYWLGAEASAAGDGWLQQRRWIYQSARAGAFWGTVTSEPGSGGDILNTRSQAMPEGDRFLLSGDKHFASGSGICSFMITTARDGGEGEPPVFIVDVRHLTRGERSPAMVLTRPWDGHGMRATQSHAWRFEDYPAERHGDPQACAGARPLVAQLSAVLFSAVVLAVVEAALVEARRVLVARADSLRAAEQMGWMEAENRLWLAQQAFEGMLAAVEAGDGLRATARGKLVLAELAETTLLELGRVLGGGSFSRSQPYGQWLQDARALGFLRPPWSLAMDQLFALDRMAAEAVTR